MNALARRIARIIESDGPISVGTFMVLALHDRDMGFYASKESIGERGAFITAPEISQTFGELLGAWCAECWEQQTRPSAPLLVDLGPGRGTLLIDMLRALRSAPEFRELLEAVLVEASPKLESLQRKRLEGASVPLRWARQWSDIATGQPLFVIANEFLDALPVRQFVMTDRGWCERMVTAGNGELQFALAPVPTSLTVGKLRGEAGPGAVYEICPAAQTIAEEIGRSVTANGGAALIIDYGHEGQGFGETLQAIGNHAPAGILSSAGEGDLSAHVDFSALTHAATKAGARVHGPVTQGDFLHALGIARRGEQLASANPDQTHEIESAIDRLTCPEAMGALFKVLAIVPAVAPTPPGFEQC